MAIPFLNNITLNNNEIQNVRLQNAGSPPLNSGPGQIYFDTTAGGETAKYYSNVTDEFVSLKEYSFPAGTYVAPTVTGTTPKPIITFDLNAVDGTAVSGERYLTKSNTWAEVASIYDWDIQGDSGGPTTVTSGDVIDIAGGTNVTTSFSGTTLTIDATDNNDNDYLTALSFNTGDGVLTATVQNQSDVTVDLDGRYLTGNETITLTGEVTGSGTTSIVTTVANGVLDVANFTAATIVTEADTIAANDNDTTIPTSAAVKAYADSLIVGGLIYQGGYNATTNTPALTGASNVALNQGDFYVVTTAGTFFTENVEVGDFIFANSNIAANSSPSLSDYTVVIADQNVAGEGATDGATQKGVAGFNSAHFNVTANGFVSVFVI